MNKYEEIESDVKVALSDLHKALWKAHCAGAKVTIRTTAYSGQPRLEVPNVELTFSLCSPARLGSPLPPAK